MAYNPSENTQKEQLKVETGTAQVSPGIIETVVGIYEAAPDDTMSYLVASIAKRGVASSMSMLCVRTTSSMAKPAAARMSSNAMNAKHHVGPQTPTIRNSLRAVEFLSDCVTETEFTSPPVMGEAAARMRSTVTPLRIPSMTAVEPRPVSPRRTSPPMSPRTQLATPEVSSPPTAVDHVVTEGELEERMLRVNRALEQLSTSMGTMVDGAKREVLRNHLRALEEQRDLISEAATELTRLVGEDAAVAI